MKVPPMDLLEWHGVDARKFAKGCDTERLGLERDDFVPKPKTGARHVR